MLVRESWVWVISPLLNMDERLCFTIHLVLQKCNPHIRLWMQINMEQFKDNCHCVVWPCQTWQMCKAKSKDSVESFIKCMIISKSKITSSKDDTDRHQGWGAKWLGGWHKWCGWWHRGWPDHRGPNFWARSNQSIFGTGSNQSIFGLQSSDKSGPCQLSIQKKQILISFFSVDVSCWHINCFMGWI